MRKKAFGIIVPCFNEEEVLPLTFSSLITVFNGLKEDGLIDAEESKIIFVDDGSNDSTWDIISKESINTGFISGIKLSRNFGHQNALLAGMLETNFDVLISIDADLQDDVSAIKEMLLEYHQGKEIVYGVRSDRSVDGIFKRTSALFFYKLISFFGIKSIYNHADFRLLSRLALSNLKEFSENDIYLRGVVPLLGLKSSVVKYKRLKRESGVTKYNLRRMIALSLSGITSFSFYPLRLISFLGFIISFISFLMIIYVLFAVWFTDSAVDGWASILVSIFFLGGIQLLSIGIIGEYLGKVFLETKKRPKYLIEEKVD